MSPIQDICGAIEQMLIIQFAYKGTIRTVEPHTVGYSKRGILTLCAWQLSGGSGQAWRDFHVDLIGTVTLTSEHFDEARSGYNPCPTNMSDVICTL